MLHILVIPCALVVCLIYMPSSLVSAALVLQVYISGKLLVPMISLSKVVLNSRDQ